MKYTQKDLYFKEDKKYLPYINMVMKNITIKENVEILVDGNGAIKLSKLGEKDLAILFSGFENAINSKTYSQYILAYEDYIVLEAKEEITTKKVYSFKKGNK